MFLFLNINTFMLSNQKNAYKLMLFDKNSLYL